MLVLSRKRDEVVRIGEEVSVRVVDVRGDKVRLGFEAPDSVTIDRQEVFEAKKRHARPDAKAAPVSVWLVTLSDSLEPHGFGFMLHAATYGEAMAKTTRAARALGFTDEGVEQLTLFRCGALDDPATINTANVIMADEAARGFEFIHVPGAVR